MVSTDRCIKKMWYVHNGMSLSCVKEEYTAIDDKIDGP